MVKCCMYPDQSIFNGKIKNAHALQNNKIIPLLSGTEHHVYAIDKKQQGGSVDTKSYDIKLQFQRRHHFCARLANNR